MRMGQGVRTGLGHGGITCVLQTQFSSFFFFFFFFCWKTERSFCSAKTSHIFSAKIGKIFMFEYVTCYMYTLNMFKNLVPQKQLDPALFMLNLQLFGHIYHLCKGSFHTQSQTSILVISRECF